MPGKKSSLKKIEGKERDINKLVLKHVLLNAVQHNGKADEKVVIGKVVSGNPELKDKISQVIKSIKTNVETVNLWPSEKQKIELEKMKIKIERKVEKEKKLELPPLPNAKKGKVVMRLAPYPSGPLHIGNARMVMLNDEYARRYDGKLFLVYDDTIGSEEKRLIPEGYKLVKEGLDWLGVKVHKIFYKSDRLPIFYKYAEEMLRKGLAYVCLCTAEELRANRKAGFECVHRKQTPEENLELWMSMLDGTYKEGGATVRLKTDMEHPNPAFRDRVLLRVSNRKHPRVGNKYHVWPLLEFSWAIDDHELGVTHILRGKDLVIEDLMEIFIWEKFGWKKSEFLHYGMLKMEEAKLSKSKSRAAIESGTLTGWDDPRTWSLQSLARRGIKPEAVRRFILRMGMSLADVTVPAEILYSENRKIVDAKAKRYFAVFEPMKISIGSVPKILKNNVVTAPVHPDFPAQGKRTIPFDPNSVYIEKQDYEKYNGEKLGLMNLFSVVLGKNTKFSSEKIEMNSQKIHWVSEPNAKIKIVMPNGEVKTAIAEPDIRKAGVGDIVQLVRNGFCRVDKRGNDIVLYFAHK